MATKRNARRNFELTSQGLGEAEVPAGPGRLDRSGLLVDLRVLRAPVGGHLAGLRAAAPRGQGPRRAVRRRHACLPRL